ncbi:hypothetical protein GC096_32385 [Paenibacillus sp. LMG 31461]|uniref:Uncharacterized protein n=1 Tax=Paenibacillus plantarum TaxID=2654975 RepID=A0ABX1XJX1_9BACL|nr:hypothetical protein [Paenibacillus plantarum]NOU68732.1 hypothetical protein [Paenibacillus plantarum]
MDSSEKAYRKSRNGKRTSTMLLVQAPTQKAGTCAKPGTGVKGVLRNPSCTRQKSGSQEVRRTEVEHKGRPSGVKYQRRNLNYCRKAKPSGLEGKHKRDMEEKTKKVRRFREGVENGKKRRWYSEQIARRKQLSRIN